MSGDSPAVTMGHRAYLKEDGDLHKFWRHQRTPKKHIEPFPIAVPFPDIYAVKSPASGWG